jgi:hypothetical protein
MNTTRQVGSVIGTAAIGALLQNRLVASLTSEATTRSAGLPAAVRAPFIAGFRQAAASGLVGGSTSTSAPAGTPHALVLELQRLGAIVFTDGFVHAMRWTMVMPIAVVALAALSCIGIRRVAAGPASPPSVQDVQMTGATSSPGSSGSPDHNPGSSSGIGS